MKTISILLIAISALLSGCVAYDAPYRDGGRDGGGYQRDRRDGDRDWTPNNADRDRDGVLDREDRRPNDPRRY